MRFVEYLKIEEKKAVKIILIKTIEKPTLPTLFLNNKLSITALIIPEIVIKRIAPIYEKSFMRCLNIVYTLVTKELEYTKSPLTCSRMPNQLKTHENVFIPNSIEGWGSDEYHNENAL